VQGILAARIDRLAPDEKALLQQLSVIGRQFPLSLIRQVITQPEADLYRLLASLQHKEFLYEQPAFPESEYIFKHTLTQEVAYGTVLQEQKQRLHVRTGQAIEQLYKDKVEEHYGELAHHYQCSGNVEKAIKYLQKAGQQAVQRSANEEAIHHLTTALALLQTLPHTREHAQQELGLHLTLGLPLSVIRGVSSPEVKETYARARELCQQVGEPHQFFSALGGLRLFHHVRGEFLAARDIGEQLLALAQREQDPLLLIEAYRALGSALCQMGEFAAARAHLEQGITLYDAQPHHSHFSAHSTDLVVFSRSYVALVLWHLGYPTQALQQSVAASTLAQERPSYLYSLGAARDTVVMIHQLRRETSLTQEWAEATVTLAHEQGFPLLVGRGSVLHGWAQADQEQSEAGIAQIHQGLAIYQAIGAGLLKSYYLVLLAEAYGKAGRAEEGLVALAEALTVVEQSGERFYEAEVYRLRGELTLNQSSVPGLESRVQQEAEACFLKAIAIAQKQQAKSLELRAVMSLARLWQKQGKTADARQLLAEIYNWFTEGFDTKDLQEAKALLQDLGEMVKRGNGEMDNG
jgi:predicted ATPase